MMDARLIANISYLVDGVAFKGHGRREEDENSRVREEAGTRDQAYFQMKPAATARGEQGGGKWGIGQAPKKWHHTRKRSRQ
jgi:hypothetical protein